MNLLAKFGGVYVDADVFCVIPLDDWLFETMSHNFFTMSLQGRDRIEGKKRSVVSWFIASFPHAYITDKWRVAIQNHAIKHKKFVKYLQLHMEFEHLLHTDTLFQFVNSNTREQCVPWDKKKSGEELRASEGAYISP